MLLPGHPQSLVPALRSSFRAKFRNQPANNHLRVLEAETVSSFQADAVICVALCQHGNATQIEADAVGC